MYLHASELAARVNLGKEAEQWLSYEIESEYNFIKWLVISKYNKQFTITYFESFDEGSSDFHDVHEFSVLDPEDAPYGITNEFKSLEDAVDFAVKTYGASANRFVAGGMIQNEYADYLRQSK